MVTHQLWSCLPDPDLCTAVLFQRNVARHNLRTGAACRDNNMQGAALRTVESAGRLSTQGGQTGLCAFLAGVATQPGHFIKALLIGAVRYQVCLPAHNTVEPGPLQEIWHDRVGVCTVDCQDIGSGIHSPDRR